MARMKRTVQGDKEVLRPPDEVADEPGHESKTAGQDRDLDESGESKNQGHGHGRERQPGRDRAGHSERTVTETDERQRDLGGPGG